MVVTSIVIVVQHSLALAFALGGIAGAVRFKNSLKSSGDALYILLSVGIGLASGIGAVELALVMSLAFNYCFVALWVSEYGEREGMKRYMGDFDPTRTALPAAAEPPAGPPGPPAGLAEALLEDFGADGSSVAICCEEAGQIGDGLAPGSLRTCPGSDANTPRSPARCARNSAAAASASALWRQ